jgi:hypothetical protein
MTYRQRKLLERAEGGGYLVRNHSPGDGQTRYRFFRLDDVPPEQGYFGPREGFYTALGIKQAETFLEGLLRR